MAKILFIGDMHIKITQFEQGKKFLEWVNNIVKVRQPDLVVNLGDTFDGHAVIRSEILSEYANHIEKVTRECPYIHIVGNHEFYKPKDSTYHTLQAFGNFGLSNNHQFIVVDRITHLDELPMFKDVTCVPYIPDFKEFPTNGGRICIAHQSFVGADYGYYRPDVGVDADSLSAEIIISGHVHKRQSFGKVIYPGSPFASSANDIDQIKGVLLFDTETYKQEFIEVPFPRYRSLNLVIDENNTVDDINKQLKSSLTDEDHWVLTFNGPRHEIVSYLKSKAYSKLIQNKKITSKIIANDKDKVKVEIKSNSIVDIINEYVDKVYNGECDKNLLKSTALSIIQST